MADPKLADLFPCLVKVHRCPVCAATLLAEDRDAHARYHRSRGDA